MQKTLMIAVLMATFNNIHAQLAGVLLIDLSIDKQVEKVEANDFFIGQQALYTITVSNLEQNRDAEAVVVSDLLPPEVSFVSDDCEGNISGQQWSWDLATPLLANSNTSCQIVVEINQLGLIQNQAEVFLNDPGTDDPEPFNNISSVDFIAIKAPILEADLAITQSISEGELLVNETANINIQVTNFGPELVTQSLVSAELPNSLAVLQSDCEAMLVGNAFNWLIDDPLNVNETTACTLTVNLNTAGDFSYLATVDSLDQNVDEIDPSNNNSTLNFTINTGAGPQPPAQPVPTLSKVMMVFLMALMLSLTAWIHKSRKIKDLGDLGDLGLQ